MKWAFDLWSHDDVARNSDADYRKLATLLFGDLGAAERADLATALERVLGKLRASAAASPDTPAPKRRQPRGQPTTD